MTAQRTSLLSFATWTIAGAGLCLGLLTSLSIGIVVLPVALVLLLTLLALPRTRNSGAVGVICGFGVVPVYVAWLNHRGPGEVCTRTAAAQSCIDEWSPWPWLAVGLALVAVGFALFARPRSVADPAPAAVDQPPA